MYVFCVGGNSTAVSYKCARSLQWRREWITGARIEVNNWHLFHAV